jgi:hypothetical protein
MRGFLIVPFGLRMVIFKKEKRKKEKPMFNDESTMQELMH